MDFLTIFNTSPNLLHTFITIFYFQNMFMKPHHNNLFCCFFLFCSCTTGRKKTPEDGKITGRIIDSASGKAVGCADYVQRMEDGKVVNGATADLKGIFKLRKCCRRQLQAHH